jgi:hypothetical protein
VTTNAKATQPDDRRSRRAEVRLPATIDAGPGRTLPVIVHNVSAHGFMAELDVQLIPGRPVSVSMAGLDRTAARVAWQRDGQVGIAFVEPLTFDEINNIL